MQVVLEEPERMNLLGLFMKEALEPRAEAVRRARPSGDIAMTAAMDSGEMSVTMTFEPERVTIRKGVVGSPRAHVRGSLDSLLQIARGNTAGPLVSLRARVSGNPLAALPLARVFRMG